MNFKYIKPVEIKIMLKNKISRITKKNQAIHNFLKAIYVYSKRLHNKILQQQVSKRKIKKIEPNHGLNEKLVVSLTSFPPRFKTLHLTLICLLTQKTKPDHLILWIAEKDFPRLPDSVLRLRKYGLEIKTCEDIRSYKKIIPSLKLYPHAFIVTADDDVFYWKNWLSELVEEYKKNGANVICHRAHLIKINPNKTIANYSDWNQEINKTITSNLVFPTGIGGVLYSPSAFCKDVTNKDIFTKLCPTADDIWLYWMHRLNNSTITTLGNTKFISWEGSQEFSLSSINTGANGINDVALANITKAYGFPF